MLKSKAPIPDDAIGLAEAFEQVCERSFPDWRTIISQIEVSSAELETRYAALGLRRKLAEHARRKEKKPETKLEISDFGQDRYAGMSSWDALNSLNSAPGGDFSPEQKEHIKIGNENQVLTDRRRQLMVEADRILRGSLARGDISAKIAGQPIAADFIGEWQVSVEYEPGFRTGYVTEWCEWRKGKRVTKNQIPDQPGPPTDLNPVFFDRGEFEAWLTVYCGEINDGGTVAAAIGAPKKLSVKAKAAKFKEWREGQNTIPSEKQDTAHMKQFGVGRTEVRDLRKLHPRRAPGRPQQDK